MKTIITTALFFICSVSFSQNITGNIFYKKNDQVGPKADAGATISLFKSGDQTFKAEAVTDIQGNYSFNSLAPGKYLLLIKSKNSTEDPKFSIKLLGIYQENLIGVAYGLVGLFDGDAYKSAVSKVGAYHKYITSSGSNMQRKVYENMDLEAQKAIYDFYSTIPIEARIRLNIKSPKEKVKIKNVELKDKDISVVTDLGKSYD